ncbi:MAG: hypothetical protein HC934_03705 [Acaryochloridaceae cyanobacterium SU_2_1]|nr:hypothetical protein [Acaryochloridaceae cyanobacterium SU_2_1]
MRPSKADLIETLARAAGYGVYRQCWVVLGDTVVLSRFYLKRQGEEPYSEQ